jgi:hypothetical protein
MEARVEIRSAGNTLDIFVGGEPFAVYNFAPGAQALWHPYFHPVLGPIGLSITQNGEFPGTIRGHYWHQGLFIAHQKLRGGTPGRRRGARTGGSCTLTFPAWTHREKPPGSRNGLPG